MRKVEGVVIGIVKEIDAGKASVKLEFPWLQASYRSNWARVAAPMSGNNRGMFMMPEKDDEVLVAFEQNCIDHPYVVGFLWNGVDKPSETTHKNRVIITPGGHALRFEDTDNAKKIIVRSSGNHEITLDDTDKAKKIIVKSSGEHEITLDDQATTVVVQLKGGGSIKMTQNDLVLQHGHSIKITSKGIELA